MKVSLEKLLCCSFEDRLRDVCSANNWGQYDDALCLATMKKLSFFIVTVESRRKLRVLHREEVVGRRVNGWKMAKPTQSSRIMVYFRMNSHYGVGVPI